MTFTLEELDLLLDVVTRARDNLKIRARPYIKYNFSAEYYEKRLKRLSDLHLKLVRLRQEQLTLRLKIKIRWKNDTRGKILDPDICRK